MSLIRLGILGAGVMGRKAAEAARATGRFEIAGFADTDVARAQVLASEFGALAFDGADALYAGGDIGAVYVGLPHDLHLAACVKAAEAQVHVLLEKPLCNTEAEAGEILAAAAGSAQVWMMGLSYRFRAEWRRASQIVTSGLIGAPYFVSDLIVEASARTPAWYWDAAAGGGVVQLQSHHVFDRLRWILDDEPQRVCGSLARMRQGADRSAQITAAYPNGVIAGISLSFGTTYNSGESRSLFVVQAEDGMVQIDHRRALRFVTGDGVVEERYEDDDWLRRELDEFAQAIDGSLTTYPGLHDGVAALRAATASVRSAETASWVTIGA